MDFLLKYGKLKSMLCSNEGKDWKKYTHLIKNKGNRLHTFLMVHLGSSLYETRLLSFIDDLHLSDDEVQELSAVVSFFELTDETVNKIKNRYNKKAVDRLSVLKYSDNVITEEEKEEINRFATLMNLHESAVYNININNALNVYNKYLNEGMEDHPLSKDEEKELEALFHKLKMSPKMLEMALKDRQALAYYKLVAEIEDGHLPVIKVNMELMPDEKAHYSIMTEKLVGTHPVLKFTPETALIGYRKDDEHLDFKLGTCMFTNTIPSITHKTLTGNLVVTNRRISFITNTGRKDVIYDKLISVHPYKNGFGIYHIDGYDVYRFDNADLFGEIVVSCLKQLLIAEVV